MAGPGIKLGAMMKRLAAVQKPMKNPAPRPKAQADFPKMATKAGR
jgi:hypothetical protein